MSLLKAERRRVERDVRENLVGAEVVDASVSVDESGQISIEEQIVRLKDGSTVSIGMRPEDPERGVALDLYTSKVEWSSRTPQTWHEVTAGDYMDDIGGGLDDR